VKNTGKKAGNRDQIEYVSLKEMVPGDHRLRQIDASMDFRRIYDFM